MTNSQRQPYVKGGVASLRQPFFLGKIAKKIGKGLKKIVKSPLGKAALIGGGLWGLNKVGIGSGGIGKNWWSKAMGTGPGRFLKGAIMGSPAGSPNQPAQGGLWNWIKGNPGKSGSPHAYIQDDQSLSMHRKYDF